MKNLRKHTSGRKPAATKKALETSGGILGLSDQEHHRQMIQIPSLEEIRRRRKAELDKEVQAIEDKQLLERDFASTARLRSTAKTLTRKDRLRSLLATNGLSIHDWAKKANVDFHTADNFLKGKTRAYPSTRKKLADALSIKVEDLPA